MDSALTPYAMEQSIATNNKQIRIKTPKKNRGGNLIANTSENFHSHAGLLKPPLLPPSRAMSLSYPKPLLSVSASVFNHQIQNGQNQKQPPLLPLPHDPAIQQHQNPPLLSRSQSSIQGGRRTNGARNTSLTAKKSKPTKREEAKKRPGTQFLISASSENRRGPDPKELPVVLQEKGGMEEMFSESGFNLISPPPSSLPLPKFSLRSKLSCNAEASVVDDGATNNLRRLLRLM